MTFACIYNTDERIVSLELEVCGWRLSSYFRVLTKCVRSPNEQLMVCNDPINDPINIKAFAIPAP